MRVSSNAVFSGCNLRKVACRNPVQTYPIPVQYPKEQHEQLWGGEGVVQGYLERKQKWRHIYRLPKLWFPTFKRSVVYSEVLDKHMSVIVTERLIKLVHSHYGFDHYLLKVIQFATG